MFTAQGLKTFVAWNHQQLLGTSELNKSWTFMWQQDYVLFRKNVNILSARFDQSGEDKFGFPKHGMA
jgi:hypothetical protein